MKWKKVVSALLVGTMAFSLAACGGGDDSSSNNNGGDSSQAGGTATDDNAGGDDSNAGSTDAEGKLVIWTFTNDLVDIAAKFTEETGIEAEAIVVSEAGDYPTKIQTALLAGETEPDIICGEPQMLEDFYDAGFFANLDDFGAKDYEGQVVDYVWKVGQDADGTQRAITYQITPAGFYYRRDIAQDVFGTDDPAEVGKLFADYPTILDTAKKLKDKGYRIFASDSELSYFSGDSAWVIDGKLNVSQSRTDYMDLVVSLYQDDLTAYANQWSTPWYQAMAGEVPILTADIQNYADDSVNVWDEASFNEATADMDKTSVFAYGLPSWGVLTLRDHVGDTSGSWGVCAGPCSGFGGGTYVGISSQSERQQTAWEFVKFCTLNPDTADWWIDFSQGDTPALVATLEKHANDENATYGGQNLFSFWQDQAELIDYTKVTRYDKLIGDAWGTAISQVKTGQKSKDDAIAEFYDTVQATYPDLVIER
ncbi:MAG: extracellular solute-binding protein [Muribaculaceae bacterium]|nr:extracellular solute-binding protein [Roseburia sp.]MCM1430612.1 extracellular solute-binding protein [Muribaculaceae bacterium]MCM1491879.1 extracellular solute-binding protein [Muribaculaceae bacterium]